MPRRRLLLTVVVVVSLVMLCGLPWAGASYFGRPPSRDWVEENLWGEHLAYEVWDGDPHAVWQEAGRVYLDHLHLDWISIELPPTPRWQYSGLWYSMPATDDPASLGIGPCTGIMGESCDKSTELYGQVNDRSISTLEVRVGETWHRYPVSYPGFALRLDSRATPTAWRWLDPNGNVVWANDTAPAALS